MHTLHVPCSRGTLARDVFPFRVLLKGGTIQNNPKVACFGLFWVVLGRSGFLPLLVAPFPFWTTFRLWLLNLKCWNALPLIANKSKDLTDSSLMPPSALFWAKHVQSHLSPPPTSCYQCPRPLYRLCYSDCNSCSSVNCVLTESFDGSELTVCPGWIAHSCAKAYHKLYLLPCQTQSTAWPIQYTLELLLVLFFGCFCL